MMPPGMGMGGPAMAPPMGGPTAPATVQPGNDGMRTSGVVLMALAMRVIEQAIPKLGAASPEGTAALKALTALAGSFGKPSSGALSQSEVKLLGERAAPVSAPGGPDMQEAIRSRLGSMGMGRPPQQQDAPQPPAMMGA